MPLLLKAAKVEESIEPSTLDGTCMKRTLAPPLGPSSQSQDTPIRGLLLSGRPRGKKRSLCQAHLSTFLRTMAVLGSGLGGMGRVIISGSSLPIVEWVGVSFSDRFGMIFSIERLSKDQF